MYICKYAYKYTHICISIDGDTHTHTCIYWENILSVSVIDVYSLSGMVYGEHSLNVNWINKYDDMNVCVSSLYCDEKIDFYYI